MKKEKIIPVILLIVHLVGVAIQSFHHHEHESCKKSFVIPVFIPIGNEKHESEDHCAICYFISQHVSCQPIEYKTELLEPLALISICKFQLDSYYSIFSIQQRAPPSA